MDLRPSDGCPICRVLREFQSDSLRNLAGTAVRNLCGFHVWSVAAATDLTTAAAIFLRLLEKSRPGEGSDESCDLCAKLALVETQKLQEMSNGLAKPEFRKWLRESGAVCLPHSQKLLSCAPEALREDIVAATKRREEDLGLRLRELLQKAKAGIPARGGLLGRVAEFLVAQRGLGRDS